MSGRRRPFITCWADKTMRALLLCILTLIAAPAIAAEVECTDRPECWPDTSGMYSALKLRDTLDTAIVRLNERFEALLKDVDRMDKQKKFYAFDSERLISELKTSQEAWLKFSSAHCAVEGMAGQAGSAWQNSRAHECEIGLVEGRISEVENIARQIREGAGEE
jgi:uncharacterized protein YecT (DUF1311 family)